ncbi:Glycosyltransferase [Azospirillaceae bacterium]
MPVLLHVYPTFNVGGSQMRFATLANQFGRAYRHIIVVMDGQTEALTRLDPSLDVEVRSTSAIKGRTWNNLKIFRAILSEIRPDVLVTSNWGSIEWAMANFDGRTPHLHMEDGFGPEEAVRQLPRRVWTRRLTLRRSITLLPSLTLYRLARDVWRLPERRLLYAPNGVDCARFGRGPDPAFAASVGVMEDGAPIIGTVAALRAEKNLFRLLDAFALVVAHRPARLVIVGDGAERADLVARSTELGVSDRVIFTGACSTPERLLPSFAVFALSSDTEQMPLSVLEAMAAGLPLASTAVGDVPSMAADDNRPFIVEKNARALATAISALLDDPTRARAIGAANAERARAVFDQQKMFDTYHSLFNGELGPISRDRRPSL